MPHLGSLLTKYYMVTYTWLCNANMLSATRSTSWHNARSLLLFILVHLSRKSVLEI